MKKVLGIILGILMCIGGFYCMLVPTVTFSSLTVVLGITFIERAIAYFVMWFKFKNINGRGLLLVNAILSIIAGIGLVSNIVTQLLVESMMLSMIAMFMVVSGIIEIVEAFKIKKVFPGANWVAGLIMGIIVVIAGIVSLTNPVALEIALGTIIAIDIFSVGVSIIVRSIAYKDKPVQVNTK